VGLRGELRAVGACGRRIESGEPVPDTNRECWEDLQRQLGVVGDYATCIEFSGRVPKVNRAHDAGARRASRVVGGSAA
jgi:hypothetical protein